jgi:cold shock CspA family protein
VRGKMLWFNEEKDHGYISTGEGERLYIPGSGFAEGKRLQGRCAGLEVEFEIALRDGEREATECSLVNEDAPRRARRHTQRRTL